MLASLSLFALALAGLYAWNAASPYRAPAVALALGRVPDAQLRADGDYAAAMNGM